MNSPEVATGDGAMGFWAALEEIYPKTRQQRCWLHKTGNVLNCLPKSVQPKAKQALHDIWQADTHGVSYLQALSSASLTTTPSGQMRPIPWHSFRFTYGTSLRMRLIS